LSLALLGGYGCGLTVCHFLVTASITITFGLLVGISIFIGTRLFTFLVAFGQEVVPVILFFRKKSIPWTGRKSVRATHEGILCKAMRYLSTVVNQLELNGPTLDHRSRSHPHRRRRRIRRRT
jgi:hypothetical protein